MNLLSPGDGVVTDFIVGTGFYKLGYVTTDREQALELLKAHYGFDQFSRFEPDLEVTTDDGTVGRAHLRCAFTVGTNVIIEVMEPLDGLVEIFRTPLEGASEFACAFHHVGVVVDDFEAADKTLEARGLHPAWKAVAPEIKVSYTHLPLLGHMVEVVEYPNRAQGIMKMRGLADVHDEDGAPPE